MSNKRETVTDEECLEARLGRGPDRIHSCNIECQEGSQSRINSGVDLLSSDTWREHSCLFSMWNEWSACSRRCGGTKRRSRTLECKLLSFIYLLFHQMDEMVALHKHAHNTHINMYYAYVCSEITLFIGNKCYRVSLKTSNNVRNVFTVFIYEMTFY